jgi:GPH family glycoside/pentoside/hexuronide:cation symporter
MITAQKVTVSEEKPFGLRDKIGYMFGDIGNTLTYSVVGSFLMIFYTNVVGISGAMCGVLFLLARFIDAIADITVGRLADNTPLTESGRFKPWIRRMKYPLVIAAVLLFLPVSRNFSVPLRLIYVFATYLIYGILYSTVNIPYGSMASAISENPNDKTSLSTFRSMGSSIGSAIVSYVIPIFMYVGATNKISGHRFVTVVAVCAALAFLSYLILSHFTTERVRTEKAAPVPFKKILTDMRHNQALVVLVVVDIIVVINQNLSSVTLSYLFNDYFQNKTAMSIALIFNVASSLILAPFVGYFTKKFGRKESSIAALAFASMMYFIILVLHTHNVLLFLGMLLLGTLVSGMFNVMVWAFITDVIDNQQIISGEHEDGMIYGVNSFARKVAQALGGGFGGIMLSVIGYQSSATGGIAQSAAVVQHIYTLMASIPTVCCGLAAIILFFFYPLNKKKIAENNQFLRNSAEIKK